MTQDRQSRAFEKLHPKVQDWVWQQAWTELKEAQEEAVDPILSGERDVIIASATASGNGGRVPTHRIASGQRTIR